MNSEPADSAPLSPITLSPAENINNYQAVLSWAKSGDAHFAGYQVYLDTVPGITETSRLAGTIILRDTTRFVLAGLDPNTQYHVRVFVRSSNASVASNEILFKTKECKAGNFTGERDPATGMVLIPAGCFSDSYNYTSNVSTPFYMDTTEVTRRQWSEVMGDGSDTSRIPVVSKTWYEALQYCNGLSKLKGRDTCYSFEYLKVTKASGLKCDFTCNGFRLPTEDEWEYAFRAGAATDFYWGQDCTNPTQNEARCGNLDSLKINDYEWWAGNNQLAGVKTVAGKRPNGFGLYDMGGNVMESVWDFEKKIKSARERLTDRTDFRGIPEGEGHVIRGGAFHEAAGNISAISRRYIGDNQGKTELGFRVVSAKVKN